MKITGENILYTATDTRDFISKMLELHSKFLLQERKQSLLIERGNDVYLHVGVGYPEGVCIEYLDDSNRGLPYFMTYNKEKKLSDKTSVVFFYFGHYSEIYAYHLVDLGKVINILTDFFEHKPIDFYNGDWIEDQ